MTRSTKKEGMDGQGIIPALIAVLATASAVLWVWYEITVVGLTPGLSRHKQGLVSGLIPPPIAVMIFAFIHSSLLLLPRRFSIRQTRRLGWYFALAIMIPLFYRLFTECGFKDFSLRSLSDSQAVGLWGSVLALLTIAQGLRAYSFSSSVIGLIPLIVFYALMLSPKLATRLFLIWPLLIAGPMLVPEYRRIGSLWRPAPLPRLRMPKAGASGYTLIELLIVIAIITILAAGILPLTSTLFGSLERQETRREAIEFVRDEMALIRGGTRILEIGIHSASQESRERYPIAKDSEVEVREGPQSELREVIIRVALSEDVSQEHAEYVALIAVRPEELLP